MLCLGFFFPYPLLFGLHRTPQLWSRPFIKLYESSQLYAWFSGTLSFACCMVTYFIVNVSQVSK